LALEAETTVHSIAIDDISLNSSRNSSVGETNKDNMSASSLRKDRDGLLQKADSGSNKPSDNMLSSQPLSLFLLFAQKMCMTFGTFIFYSASFFVLVPVYNISISWTTAVAYLTVLVGTYTTVFVGYYGDHIGE